MSALESSRREKKSRKAMLRLMGFRSRSKSAQCGSKPLIVHGVFKCLLRRLLSAMSWFCIFQEKLERIKKFFWSLKVLCL